MIRRNTLVFSTVTTMARQRLGLDEARCTAILDLIDACVELDRAVHAELARQGLSDVKFGILVTLFTREPDPVCPADLAGYAGYTRSSVTDAVQDLQARGLVVAERGTADRRSVEVRLTDPGRTAVERAIDDFLSGLGAMTQALADEPPESLRRIAGIVTQRAQLLSA